MRAFEGQFSDNKPIQRNRDEKRRLLRELEETLASLKSHASPSLRESLKTRIQALKAEVADGGRPGPAGAAAAPARPPRR